jgi:hypothetical protein
MMKTRIQRFLESILFAGLKPGAQAAPKQELRWLGPLRGPLERFLSGPAPADPLYLSNRTGGQKFRSWSLIAIPCLVLAIGIGVVLSNLIDPPVAKPAKQPTPAELAAKLLPNLDKNIQLKPPSDLQVLEIRVIDSRVVGALKNTASHDIPSAEIVVDLTNAAGSQVGAVSGIVDRVPALGSKGFQIPITQRDAAFGLVREIKSR